MEVDYEVLEPWRKLMERLTHLSEIRNVELVGLLTQLGGLQKQLILTDRLLSASAKAVEFYLGMLTVELAKVLPTRSEGGCQEPLNDVLLGCLATYLKYGHLSQYRLYEMLDPLFNGQQKWYLLNPASLYEVVGLHPNQDFLGSLKLDDRVDVVSRREQNLAHWLPGRIVLLDKNYLKVVFADGYVETIPVGWQVQPEGSRCCDWQWRLNITSRQLVDACDSCGVWITSTIVQVEEDPMKVEIGFRVDSPLNQDSLEAYIGWSSKYDTTMSVFDPRLQRANTLARTFCKSASKKDRERVVEDTNDLLFLKEYNQQKIYAVQRDDALSPIYFELVRKFGANGGFERLLEQLANKDITPQETEALMNLLYRLSERLTKMFCKEFVPKLREVAWSSLTGCSDSFIRKLTRENIHSILLDLGTMMKRHFSIDQKKEWLEKLALEVAKRCIHSEYLERKIQGLKNLEEYMKALQNERSLKERNTFLEWLDREEIFQEIYGPHTHVELLSRSQQFFKYVVSSLPVSRVKQFWVSMAKQDSSFKDIMYKLLNDCSRKFRDNQVEAILDSLEVVSAADINEDLLEFFYDIANKQERQEKVIMFVWNALMDHSREFRPKMKDRTTDKLIHIIRGMTWPGDVVTKLIGNSIKRPMNKIIVSVLMAVVGHCKHISSQQVSRFIEHLVKGLEELPEKKYGYLGKLMELLMELERVDDRLEEAIETRIIAAVKPAGSIPLLTFLTKRNSNRMVYPPVETLTPESFKMVMEMFDRNLRSNEDHPRDLPFFPYLISVLECHQSTKVQQLASQVIALLYIRSYQEVREKYLCEFLKECLEKNSLPYYRIIRLLIEGIQTNWPYSTFANVVAPSTEVQLTVMNDIIICKDPSRSFVFKVSLNQSLRNLFSLLSHKTELSRLELKLTYNHHELHESDSIKTIYELGLKNSAVLHLSRGSPNRRPLINSNRELTTIAKEIFTEAFNANSTDGKMSKDQFDQYYRRYSYSGLSIENYRLERIFSEREQITLEDFLKYYEKEASESDYSVRPFVERMGYLSDLTKKSQPHQTDIMTAPSALITRNQLTYDELFDAAHHTDSSECQKQIVTLLLRLPVRRRFFAGRPVLQLVVELAEETNPYVIWYRFAVLKFIYRKEPNSHFLELDPETIENWYSELTENGVPLVLGCLKKIYEMPRESYIVDTLLEDLLVLLHDMLLVQGTSLYKPLEKLIPKFEDLKNPYFVPDHPKPDHNLDVDLKWLLPKKEYTGRINELIYEMLVIAVVLGDASAWSSQHCQLEGYRFEKLQLWSLSLSLWRGKMPPGGLEELLSTNQYELAAFVVRHYSEGCDINFEELTSRLVGKLFEYESAEMRNSTVVDWKLVGLLTMLDTIFQAKCGLAQSYDTLAQRLLYGYLFPEGMTELPDKYTPEQQPKEDIKCFSKESREKAFSIVACIARNNPKEHEIIMRSFLDRLTGNVPLPRKFQRRSSPIRSELSFVGLRNLGATCYMNAILQQMYCCEPLRRCIMGLDQASTPFMEELQKLFTYLEFSERADFEPIEFFKHVRMGGVPAPTNVQQDAHEFLNFFFDQLELAFAKTPVMRLIKQIYCGTFASQIICQGCSDIKQSLEGFYDISLEVKEKATLYQSFEKLIQGESIAGYYCEKCQGKQTVHKRVLLDKLPNHLTLNLQRIVFDLDTFVNRKIHSRLEFPEVLNLTAFTKQTIDQAKNRKPTQMEDEEQQRRHENHSTTESHLYQYRLTGIVVHLGAAEAGHYYSLIRSNDKWIVFDDSRISQFEDTIENECYGGASVSSDDWNKEVDYSKNAYVLMYERVHKQKIVLESVGEQELQAIQPLLTSRYLRQFEEDPVQLHESQLCRKAIDRYWSQVVKDNHLLLRENMYLSEEFSSFAAALIQQLSKPILSDQVFVFEGELPREINELYEIAFRYLTYMIFDMGAKLEVDPRLVTELYKLLRYVPRKAELLLSKYLNIYFLLNCTKQFRTQIKMLYAYVLCVQAHLAGKRLNSATEAFLDGILKELNGEVAKNWTKSYEYFDFLKDLMTSPSLSLFRDFLISRDIISLMLDFAMDKDSPVQLPNTIEKKYQIGSSIQIYTLLPLCQIVLMAVQNQQNLKDQSDIWHPSTVPLSKTAKTLLQSEEVLKRLMKDRSTVDWVSCMVCYNCLNNLQYSQKIARLVLQAVGNSYSAEDMMLYCPMIRNMLMITDEYTEDRLQLLLGFPQLNMNGEGSFALTTNVRVQVFSYPSAIRGEDKPTRSLLDLLCKDRLDYKPFNIVLMNLVVNLCSLFDHVFQHIARLPAPGYYHAHYFQWMEQWLIEFNSEYYKHQKPQFNSKEYGENTYQIYLQIMQRYNRKIQESEQAIRKTSMVFSQKRGIKVDHVAPETGISKALTKQYVYGCTYRITQIIRKEIEPGLSLVGYDYYIYRALSKPTGIDNRLFPRLFADIKGKIDSYELNLYTDMARYVHTNQNKTSTMRRYELVEEEDPEEISFSPIFSNVSKWVSKKDKKKPQEQLPPEFTSQIAPPLDESTTLRVFFLLNDTPNRYELSMKIARNMLSYLPKQLTITSAPKTTRLTLVSLQQHDAEVQIMGKEEVAIAMQIEPAIKRAESEILPEDAKNLEGLVSCPNCTLLNPIDKERCEMCDAYIFGS